MENQNHAYRQAGKNKIIPQMFDVRPVGADGELDLEKINRCEKIVRVEAKKKLPISGDEKRMYLQDIKKSFANNTDEIKQAGYNADKKNANVYQLGQAFESRDVPVMYEVEHAPENFPNMEKDAPENVLNMQVSFAQSSDYDAYGTSAADFENDFGLNNSVRQVEGEAMHNTSSLVSLFSLDKYKKSVFSFSGVAVVVFIIIFSVGFFNKGLKIKDLVSSTGKDAYADLALAKEGMAGRDFQKSSFEFNEAYEKFSAISNDINNLGGILVGPSRFIPFFSKLSSGNSAAQAGKDIAQIGILSGKIMQSVNSVKNPLNDDSGSVSFLKIFQDADKNLQEIVTLLKDADENLAKVNLDDIPEAQRTQFVELKSKLPGIENFITDFSKNSQIFTDVLGSNGPRKYLFLFQNNQEMRATGGFIGTYGIMDISNGNIRKFFIDGIFNPDGQLKEKVVPPIPIQKISATWSLHDSNWFPDFPKSAEKAAWFYEKTGGPTVDGVITMTPTVMQKLLEVTGPIEMPEYNVTVDADNFTQQVQQEVEVDYDKKLNQPKKILADLAPKILDKIFNARNFSDMAKTISIFMQSLNEKQILIYSKNYEIEKILSDQGWSGEMLNTQKDYLSVINTNINGYKTDGVIDESIDHQAEIQSDGSVIDTVTITRHHNGGNLAKDWWNKVNADYMRVYVPKGSTLLSADGQTREFDSPPLDYNALGFKHDAQVQTEEDSVKIDDASGTRVYEDTDKTVFANWVYVSPQETVVVKYKYLLPFKISMNTTDKLADTYSLLAQKQSGSAGSKFTSTISYPDNYNVIWSYPDEIVNNGSSLKTDANLKTDKFIGAAFTKK